MEGIGGVGGLTPGTAVPGARPVSWGGALAASFLAALARPRWWAIALASFLVRGGVIVVVLPIMTLPTVATITNLISPTIHAVAFGNPPPNLVAAYAIGGAILAAWAVIAIVLGSWLDLALAAEVALDEDMALGPRRLSAPLRRAIVVRLAAHAGTLVAAVYAVVRLIVEAYAEILSPGDATIPLAWRIALRAPDAIAVLGGTWLVGEAVGGLASRGVASGAPIFEALLGSVRRLLRPAGLATLLVTNLGVALAIVPLWLASSRTWDLARMLLVGDAPAPMLVAALLLVVGTWALGLALLAAGLAWRSAAWTAEASRSTALTASRSMATTTTANP